MKDTKYLAELGRIKYVNLSSDRLHGEYETARSIAQNTGKPIFANIVEWPGCAGVQDVGKHIFHDPDIVSVIEEFFFPAAFNTWDRFDSNRNHAMKSWAGELARSDWGYVRIVAPDGTVLSGTGPITGRNSHYEVRQAIIRALESLGEEVPSKLRDS